MRSYCIAQETMSNLLGQTLMEDKIRKRMYDWVTLLCNRKWHNIANQLYFNKTLKMKKKKFRLPRREGG